MSRVQTYWLHSDPGGGDSCGGCGRAPVDHCPSCHRCAVDDRDADSLYEAAQPTIETLIERSSLGTPEAKAARARTSDEQVEKLMSRLRALEGARQRVLDAAVKWWDDDEHLESEVALDHAISDYVAELEAAGIPVHNYGDRSST